MSERKLQFGEVVVLTKRAREQGLQGKATTPFGTFLRYAKEPGMIVVRRAGLVTPQKYARRFWREQRLDDLVGWYASKAHPVFACQETEEAAQ